MKYFYYIAPDCIDITDILSVQQNLKICSGFEILDVEHSTDLNIRKFDQLSWEFFDDCTYYVLVGRVNPNPDAFRRLYMVLSKPHLIDAFENFSGSIRYNERELKQEDPFVNSLRLDVGKSHSVIRFTFQDASRYRVLPNGPIELSRIIEEAFGYVIDRNNLMIPNSVVTEILPKLYNLLGDQLIRAVWNMGLTFPKGSREAFGQLDTIFREAPDADKRFLTMRTRFLSWRATEQFFKIMDDETRLLYPMGAWSLKKLRNKQEVLIPSFQQTRDGYRFVAACHQPLHEGVQLKPEMARFMDQMNIDITKPVPEEKIKNLAKRI